MPRLRRTRRNTRGNPLLFRHVLVVDAIDAERTLAHHAFIFIELARAVRARPGAQLAADTDVGVDQHDAILGALIAGAGGTDGDAGRLLAVQTGPREMHGAAIRPLPRLVGVHAIQPDAVWMVLIRVEVGQRRGVPGGV